MTSLSCIGILIAVIIGCLACLSSGIRSQVEREREFNKWLREQLESLSGDQWNGEDKG